MSRESDTIVVATFTGAADCASSPPSNGCQDQLIEAEIVELLKGKVQIGTRILVPGSLGEPEGLDREDGFEFASSACQRTTFAQSRPEASNLHVLFLTTSAERPRRRLAERRTAPSSPGEGPYFDRSATCQQPNAEPITGGDDPWYRFVKAAIAAQTQTPPLSHERFLESVADDPSWLIRREAYQGHRSIDFRRNGVLDPDPRIRRLAGRSLYGPMFEALAEVAARFRRDEARWPRSDEMAALTEMLPNSGGARRVSGVVADPWGSPYVLRGCGADGSESRPCDFVSIGADHVAGTHDDFSSLELRDVGAWRD
jgi:hypothetical protein